MGPGNRHDDEPSDDNDEGRPEGMDDEPGDELDDEPAASRGPIPDPLDRVWLHPTELPAFGAAFAPTQTRTPAAGARHRSLSWLAPLVAGAAGALLTVGVLAVAGTFDHTSIGADSTPTTDGATTRAATVVDTLTRLSPSVVAVVAQDAKGTRRGSGVCVRHGRQLLTSTRVVGAAATVQVLTSDGQSHTARVAGRDRVTNLVLLDLEDGADLPAAQLADEKPQTGTAVWLLGAQSPGESAPWMSGGMASSNDAMVASDLGPTTDGLLETDATISSGAVGGALVDGDGSVAGIVLGHVNGSSTTFAVSIDVAVAVAGQLDATGVAHHGWMGMTGVDTRYGPMISAMATDTPAARAGLHVRDLVEAVDGRAVNSVGEVTAIVQSMEPGETVVFDLLRANRTLEISARLGATPG
jgi:S1-C subfamily serine protease